jgi:hypothetical protein
MQQHSQQLIEGLVNIAIVWKQDLQPQQAFFYGRSGGEKNRDVRLQLLRQMKQSNARFLPCAMGEL